MYEQAQKTPDLMKGFVNTVLGLPFEEEAEAPEWQRLYERARATASASCPTGPVPDRGRRRAEGPHRVRGGRLGPGKESWSVDSRVSRATPPGPRYGRSWTERLPETGHMPPAIPCRSASCASTPATPRRTSTPGSGSIPRRAGARPGLRRGSRARQLQSRGAIRTRRCCCRCLKADAGGRRRELRVWSVGTPVAKGELYRWLKLEWPTEVSLEAGRASRPGACHFPQYGEEYFKQLTAERLVTRIVKGFPRGSWEKEPGRRNEALDCRVYARAAAAIYGLDRFEERHWRRMEEALARTVRAG